MRKNGNNVIITGNFQVVHGDAFFLGKNILWITVPCMNPFEGEKKKFKGDIQRIALWDDSELTVNRGISQAFLKLNPELHLSAVSAFQVRNICKYSLKSV